MQQGLQGAKLIRLQGSLLAFERVLVLLIIVACCQRERRLFSQSRWPISSRPSVQASPAYGRCEVYFSGLRLDRTLLPRMLKFSLPILPASFSATCLPITWMHFSSLTIFPGASFGVYAVVYLISGNDAATSSARGNIMMPFFVTLHVGGEDERVARLLHNVLPLLTLAWAAACAFVAAAGGYFLPIIFGAQFSGLSELLWPLMAAAALAGPALMGYAPFSTRGPLHTFTWCLRLRPRW